MIPTNTEQLYMVSNCRSGTNQQNRLKTHLLGSITNILIVIGIEITNPGAWADLRVGRGRHFSFEILNYFYRIPYRKKKLISRIELFRVPPPLSEFSGLAPKEETFFRWQIILAASLKPTTPTT